MDTDKKIALISGGTSGIGLAAADFLMQRGWNVVLSGRNKERGRAAATFLAKNEGEVRYIQGDVSCDQDCAEMTEQTVAAFGHLDGLVTSAGYYKENLLEQTSPHEVQQMFATNVYGTMSLCRYSLPHLKKSGGAIVTVASDAGIQGNVACSVYGATKGAVVAFTKSLALETAPYQVRVNCVCPGDVVTPLLEKQLHQNPELTLADIKEHYPLFRLASPPEIGKAIAFLLSNDASFITAVALPVDGGLTSW